MKKNISLLIILAALFSCEEAVKLDLKQTGQKIVIEGLVTTRANDNFVRLTRTRGFYEAGGVQSVTGATVTVSDDAGNVYTFMEPEEGHYVPQTHFNGVVGRTYKLRVAIGQDIYEAEDKLVRVAEVDSVRSGPVDDPDDEQIDKGDLYNLKLYFKEPQDTRDYYLFKFYREGFLKVNDESDVYVISDEILDENIDGFPSPVSYKVNDKATMEMYSLSRNAYLYYSDLSNLLLSDGGMFGPVPSNPRTNITNGALGLFQASAVVSVEHTIEKED